MSYYLRLCERLGVAIEQRARLDRTLALDLDFYDYNELRKPWPDRRFCVAQFQARGRGWRRTRRISGPMRFDPALDELINQLKRTGIPHVRDA